MIGILRVDGRADCVDPRRDIVGRRGERFREFRSRAIRVAVLAPRNAHQVMRRRKGRLQVDDALILRSRSGSIADPMRFDGARP